MSPRAACRLESLGFTEVYDYMPGKVDWLARGLGIEGEASGEVTAGSIANADAVTCTPEEAAADVAARIDASPLGFALVLSPGGIVLGRLRRSTIESGERRAAGEVMEAGPSTIRPHLPAEPLLQRLRESGLRTAVVTTPDGELIGVVDRKAVEAGGPR